MSKKPDGGPAFPLQDWDEHIHATRRDTGMSLRDYFAAKAMQGDLANSTLDWETPNFEEGLVRQAYLIADAMLKERMK